MEENMKKLLKKLFKKVSAHLRYWWRCNVIKKPLFFDFISESDLEKISGEKVSPELEVDHPTFHDMDSWFCCWKMTEEKMLRELSANAILVTNFKWIGECRGITTFQPYKIVNNDSAG